jgi:Na+/phosphate symporter
VVPLGSAEIAYAGQTIAVVLAETLEVAQDAAAQIGVEYEEHYVMQLDPEGLSDEEHRRLAGILAFSLNLESGSDVIERNILPLAARQMKCGVELSHEAEREIEATFQVPRNNRRAAASIFMTGDPRAARALIEQKRSFVAGRPTRSAPISPSCGRAMEGRAAARPVTRHQALE